MGRQKPNTSFSETAGSVVSRTGSDAASSETAPSATHQSARLMLRSTAAKVSPHASRASIINSISKMVVATSTGPGAVVGEMSQRPRYTQGAPDISAFGTMKYDEPRYLDADSDGSSEVKDQTSMAISTPGPDGVEGAEDFTPGSARRAKTTYTREEKLEALERYHLLVEQTAALKNGGSSTKSSRTRVTIMDGARMAGVEYQTFRNWLRAEADIRRQAPGSKNAKRGRRSNVTDESFAGTLDDISDIKPDDDLDHDEMMDILDQAERDGQSLQGQALLHAGSSFTPMPPDPSANKAQRVLRQTGEGSRVVKRTSVQRLPKSVPNMTISAPPSSFGSRRESPLTTSSSSSSLVHSECLDGGSRSSIMASSVDKHSSVLPSSSVRSSRLRMTTIQDNCEVDTCTISCSTIGTRAGQVGEIDGGGALSMTDIQQLSHPRIMPPSPPHMNPSSGMCVMGAGDQGLGESMKGYGRQSGATVRVVRSEVSHASIEGNVWLINCTVKNSKIVGRAGPAGAAAAATMTRAGEPGLGSSKAMPQRSVFVLSNCRIENATVVGTCGAVFDGQSLQDGVFESTGR